MKAYVVSFLVAALASVMLTPVVRAVALRAGIVTNPGGRHIHSRSIPRAGGVAIFLAFFTPLVALYFAEGAVASAFQQDGIRLAGLLLGGFIMFALGLLDDVRGVRALHKLYVQLFAGAIAYAFHFRIDNVGLPFFGPMSMGVFSLPITMLWFVGVINAVNLIDGLDGLAAGVVFFAGVTHFIVANLTDVPFVALLMSALLGSVFGFLFYNFNPARIFMGDSGSYFLGFVLAATGIAAPYQKATATVSLLVPVVSLGVPIIDTLLAMVRRFLEQKPLFSPDRGHIHHRLLDMGITHRRAVLIIYAVSIFLTASAIGISFGRSWQVGVAILAASVVLFGLVRFIGYFEYINVVRRQRSGIQSRQTNVLRHLVPTLPAILDGARTEDELWTRVGQVVQLAKLERAELLRAEFLRADGLRGAAAEERVIKEWKGVDVVDANVRELVSARYGISASPEIQIKFCWRSEFGTVSPQTDILLQIVADMIHARLRALTEAALPESSAMPAHAAEPTTAATPQPVLLPG